MNEHKRFDDGWEPVLLSKTVLAEGTWVYQDAVVFDVQLIRKQWDYTASDIPALELGVSDINADYIDYAVSEDGRVYIWEFSRDGSVCSESPHFSSQSAAEAHFQSYGGTAHIKPYKGKLAQLWRRLKPGS